MANGSFTSVAVFNSTFLYVFFRAVHDIFLLITLSVLPWEYLNENMEITPCHLII